ncbi:hypothetical protein HID58_015824 [Brassica napus]|uniref:Uncharacterized protein n=1 Tax=Brassica napus TaxID=3708 RepID=A0ABQ8DM18_BRANA|nr:hypothetical protein HID58_015824 [Brassica napus]
MVKMDLGDEYIFSVLNPFGFFPLGPSPIYKQFLTPGGVFTTIKDERCSSTVEVRLLRFLAARNVKLGTHRCFNKETYAGESYFYKLVSKDTGNTSAASLLRGYAKVVQLALKFVSPAFLNFGGVKFVAPSVLRNFSGLSHPLPACTATILMLLVSSGLFDGFDWEMTNLHNISAYEAGSVDMQEAPTTGAAPSGADNKKPPAGAASKMAKKAWMT